MTRWWFQIVFIFTPIWGRFPIWRIFFRWVETTNQMRWEGIAWFCLVQIDLDDSKQWLLVGEIWSKNDAFSPSKGGCTLKLCQAPNSPTSLSRVGLQKSRHHSNLGYTGFKAETSHLIESGLKVFFQNGNPNFFRWKPVFFGKFCEDCCYPKLHELLSKLHHPKIHFMETNISHTKALFEDDFPFPQAGCVSSLEGTLHGSIFPKPPATFCLILGLHESHTFRCQKTVFDTNKTEAWWWAICLEGCLPARNQVIEKVDVYDLLFLLVYIFWMVGREFSTSVCFGFFSSAKGRIPNYKGTLFCGFYREATGSTVKSHGPSSLVRKFTQFQQNLDWWNKHCTGI